MEDAMSADDNKNKPWVSNYPVLKNWLEKIGARCMEQNPVGSTRAPTAYLERWMTPAGRSFIVGVRGNRMGWNVYTDADTPNTDLTLADAEQRFGL
jgi:hypothetical protein